MAQLIRLQPYEAYAAIPLATRGVGTYTQKLWAEGSGILSTLFVQSVDPGASVKVTYYDVSLGDDLGEQMLLARHDTITTNLQSHKIMVTRFHSKPYMVAEVTGGSATFGVFASLSEANPDADYYAGKTLTFTGELIAPAEIDLPATPERVIQGFSVRCNQDQSNSHRLLFSIDGGLNYIILAPGQAFSLAPRGDLRQLRLKSENNHTVLYEVVMNMGA